MMREKKLKIKTIVADIGEKKIRGNYDIILGLGIFHFFPRDKAIELIEQIKKQTKKQGINVIDAFIGKNYFKEGQLKKI